MESARDNAARVLAETLTTLRPEGAKAVEPADVVPLIDALIEATRAPESNYSRAVDAAQRGEGRPPL